MIGINSTLGEICQKNGGLIQTGPFGSQLHQSDYTETGVPVVMPKDIVDGKISVDCVARIPETKAQQLSRHLLRQNSIVLPRRGDISKRAYIKEDQAGFFCGSGCLQIITPDHLLDARYLYYYLAQDQVVEWLERNAIGTTMLNLSMKIVENIPFCLIPLITQKKIASILSNYDDLIENNRRRIQLLERSLHLLYKEWFVHLRFPSHEHSKIVDGIPEGWRKAALKELAIVNQSSINSSFQGQIEYIDISSVTTNSINQTTILNFEDAPSRARRIVKHGDIIWSCVRPNRESYAVIWNPPDNLIVSTGFAVITPKSVPASFLFYAITTPEFVGYLANNARGAAYPAVTASDFENAQITFPQDNLLNLFNEIATPVFTQINTLRQQSKKLQQARDLLLPKLMSGAIGV